MDREGTIKAFSNLDAVTDLVYAAYVEKPTMAETVEPNARMLTNTLEALAARNVPLKRIVLAGGAKSYGFSLGSFNAPAAADRNISGSSTVRSISCRKT
jgi:nucleoside-diphosphate-sugar epimerase